MYAIEADPDPDATTLPMALYILQVSDPVHVAVTSALSDGDPIIKSIELGEVEFDSVIVGGELACVREMSDINVMATAIA